MTVKEYFSKGRKLNFEIKELMFAKNNAFDLACSATPALGGERVQSSAKNSSEEKIITYANYSAEIEKRVMKLCKYRLDMINLISKLENPIHRTILFDRYINCLSWEEIACRLEMTKRHIYRLHGKALAAADVEYKKIENT